MLVGVEGSGKQSHTQLATIILGFQTFQIRPGRTYQAPDSLTDLRELYSIIILLIKTITPLFSQIMKLR
jgi:hypothetical protein